MRKIFLGIIFLCLLTSCSGNTIFDNKQTDTVKTSDTKIQNLDPDPHPNLSHLKNEKFATPDNPVISPSGKYKMVIESGYNGVVYYNNFVIHKTEDDTLLYSSPAQFRTRDRLMFAWDELDNVWIYTADMGICWWEKENDIWVNNNKNIEPEYYQGIFEE